MVGPSVPAPWSSEAQCARNWLIIDRGCQRCKVLQTWRWQGLTLGARIGTLSPQETGRKSEWACAGRSRHERQARRSFALMRSCLCSGPCTAMMMHRKDQCHSGQERTEYSHSVAPQVVNSRDLPYSRKSMGSVPHSVASFGRSKVTSSAPWANAPDRNAAHVASRKTLQKDTVQRPEF